MDKERLNEQADEGGPWRYFCDSCEEVLGIVGVDPEPEFWYLQSFPSLYVVRRYLCENCFKI